MAIRYLFLNGITGRKSIADSFSSKPNPLDTWPDDKLIREFRITIQLILIEIIDCKNEQLKLIKLQKKSN